MNRNDTIFALSSGRPPAAVSIIRLSGPDAHRAAIEVSGDLPAARRAAVRELRDPDSGDLLDRALLLRFDGPASATGEDVIELHCHGGRAVVNAVLEALGRIKGLREAEAGEFTRRSFASGRLDLTEVEGLADLLEAETESQRRAAIALAEGGLRRQIEKWRESLVGLSARAERAIDYDDDDLDFDRAIADESTVLASHLAEWLERPRVEPLKDGVKVVVAGPPNAGKSSLINALAGSDKAIVTDVPGTTRDSIEVPLSVSGLPICLTDTAGLRPTTDRVEALGIRRAELLVHSADVLVWLGRHEDAPAHARLIRVHAKADLPGRSAVPEGSLSVSALTGQGLGNLLAAIEGAARSMLPDEDQIALNRRQASLISDAREALSAAGAATDLLLCAEELRRARLAFDRLTGRTGVEDVLDALFSRFCLGK